jgi:hypothetical protein
MQLPQMTLGANVVRATTVDTSLHEIAGISWHVLLPYTFFGAGLMVYSQLKLTRGQHILRQQATVRRKKRSPKRFAAMLSLPNVRVVINRFDIQRSR